MTPSNPQTLARLAQVMDATGLKKTQLYELIKRGDFPPPVPISVRSVAWVMAEVQSWISGRIDASRDKCVTGPAASPAASKSCDVARPGIPATKLARRVTFAGGGA